MAVDHLTRYLDMYGDALNTVPSIYYIWKKAQPFVQEKNEEEIKKIENLIFILFNSVVSPKVKLGRNVKFAYGGIGTVVHKDAVIGDGVAVGQGVTIGGSPGKFGVNPDGRKFFVPQIQENVYIAAGSRIFGGVKIGKYSVIGANSVVNTDVDEFSIYAGQPARKKSKITKKTCINYRSFFHDLKNLSEEEFVEIFPE